MNDRLRISRRAFLRRSGVASLGLASAGAWGLPSNRLMAKESTPDVFALIRGITDPEIRTGMEAAVFKNLMPAATERVDPGHFTINADGSGYGSDSTWPGLDSWQMIGPYLHLGRTRLVLDYFDFVRASQRKDGNIPFAIFNGNTRPGGCLRGLAPCRRAAPRSTASTPPSWCGWCLAIE